MREILEANARRHLEVVEYLYISENWLTLKVLAQKIGSSERILKQDIIQLREQISNEVLQTSHHGIRLVLPSHKKIDEIYRSVLENSLAFNFIEKLIYDETKTVVELAEELYVSTSTLLRLIKKLNISLEPYYVQVQSNPCKLFSENEENIRYFYINYFSERYSSIEWPYKTINQNLFEQLLILLMKINHISLDISDFKRLKLWTAIPFLRDQQGHYIDIKPSAFSDMIPDFSNFQPLTVLIEKELAITLDKEFIEQIFSVFINNDFALSYEYLTEAATTNLVIKEKITDIASILHNISTHLGIVIPNRNHLLKEIYNISNFAFKTKKGYYPPPFILFDSKKSFVKSVEELFPDFINAAFENLNAFEKKNREMYSDSARNEIIYTLIVQWENLIPELYKQKEKIHLLIISDLDFEHAKMIQDLLNYHFKQEIITEIFKESTISLKQINKQPHDVLITNFTLGLGEENCVCIQNIPTKRNLECIRLMIEEKYKLKSHFLRL